MLFNKPYGVLCQFSPQAGRLTLKDFIPHANVYPVGRLDADSEGLVILTADGALQHRIADPRHQHAKTYLAQVEGVPSENALDRLRQGLRLGEITTQPAEAHLADEPLWLWPRTPPIRERRAIPTAWLELRLREGKNRQVRHMTAAVGLPTLRLIRYSVGDWTIEGLAPGQWRAIEVESPTSRRPPPARSAAHRRRIRGRRQ